MLIFVRTYFVCLVLESGWNVMARGDAREGKWRGKLANGVGSQYPTHYLGTWYIQLPVVDWTGAPADLNGLVCFAERRNLVSARVPSHFKHSLLHTVPHHFYWMQPSAYSASEEFPRVISKPKFDTVYTKAIAVGSWLRHYATSRKVAGSISDYVTRISHWYNPSGRTRALGSNQPLTEMSTWGVKAAGA